MREGPLLKSLATCGHCSRRLSTHATGHPASPGYHCAGAGRSVYCLSVDAVEIDATVARAVSRRRIGCEQRDGRIVEGTNKEQIAKVYRGLRRGQCLRGMRGMFHRKRAKMLAL